MAKDSSSGREEPGSPRQRAAGAEDAFDLWLQRRLSQMFDAVAEEPLPEDLLRLLRGEGKPQG